ncbi:DNA-formamidopyrimidine glycosylase [Candidatus Woesearchaeota archaeon]|jgi:formamidopyrimidine-DNA glycosylase|nr:DNA-formamidopyrimidine glycosylase [Candidatus Woesearchaeota archaeon]MBT5739621.1 DNA-formamidopyrimidine glycosylase [Candidatus Woesearchaeota archaeon]
MPELPEVETVVRQLRRCVVGKTISRITVLDEKVIDPALVKVNKVKISEVKRRGKSIIFSLSNGKQILTHLRMTGHFHYSPNDKNYLKYLAGIFRFTDGSFLTHNSIRRFGGMNIFTKKQLENKLNSLGPEPLEVTPTTFSNMLKQFPNASIKSKLLDQQFMVGVGNIYAQEAMYASGIHPEKKVNEVNDGQLKLLHREMKSILREAIKNNGTTVDNYTHIAGKGNFQNFLSVYGRDNCPKGHKTEKVKISGRGTYYCPKCQPC